MFIIPNLSLTASETSTAVRVMPDALFDALSEGM